MPSGLNARTVAAIGYVTEARSSPQAHCGQLGLLSPTLACIEGHVGHVGHGTSE